MADRLQKIIARAGVASRRKAEELILAGRVAVNGEVIRILGSRADPEKDTVSVDGKTLRMGSPRRYLAMNKPKGHITSTSDPLGRRTVMDLLGARPSKGLFPVGRLDYNTEGLLLLTDDGDFANRILTARNKVPKTYEVKISGSPSQDAIQKLRDGMMLDGRLSKPLSIRLVKPARNPWYEITLVEGRNRQIHRMFQRIGFLVEKIRRTSIGTVTLRGLEPRQVRELQRREVDSLLAGDSPPRAAKSEPIPGGRTPGQRRPARGRSRHSRSGPGRRRPRAGGSRRAGKPAQSAQRTGRLRRSGKRQRPQARRRPTGGRSRARAGTTAKAGSRGRRPARSRARQSSRRGSRPKP